MTTEPSITIPLAVARAFRAWHAEGKSGVPHPVQAMLDALDAALPREFNEGDIVRWGDSDRCWPWTPGCSTEGPILVCRFEDRKDRT